MVVQLVKSAAKSIINNSTLSPLFNMSANLASLDIKLVTVETWQKAMLIAAKEIVCLQIRLIAPGKTIIYV